MSVQRTEVVAFLQRAVRGILERDGQTVVADITENTRLFGREGVLSSLMLVELMLEVEDFCAENRLCFTWANDAAMSERRSAYRTVASLTDLIVSLPPETASEAH